MNDRKALICDQCGAPMQTNRECVYCGTHYYNGPEITPPDVVYGNAATMYIGSASTTGVYLTGYDPAYLGGTSILPGRWG